MPSCVKFYNESHLVIRRFAQENISSANASDLDSCETESVLNGISLASSSEACMYKSQEFFFFFRHKKKSEKEGNVSINVTEIVIMDVLLLPK